VRHRFIVAHVARIASSLALLVVVPALAPLAALAAFLAIFALVHDLAHGALGLPKLANDLALAIAGVLIATTGHGLRVAHLRHHARPMADDDLEGAAAHVPLWRAALAAPGLALRLHASGWREAPRRARRWQRVEYLAVIALVGAAALGPHALRVLVAVAVAMQLTAPVWAGHVPHRPPRWLLAIARRLAFTRSPTVISLLHHDLHHRLPRVPVGALSAAAS